MKKIHYLGIFFAVFILLTGLTGCDLLSKYLGIDFGPNVKITDPTNGKIISGVYTFIGSYSGPIDSISVKIGDQQFYVEELLNGTWKIDIDLTTFSPGDYTVTSIGYEGNRELDRYSINVTIEGSSSSWNEIEGGYYIIFKDEDYSDTPAKLTDITTDTTNLYISGYYQDTSAYTYKPFVYKINPETGEIIKKYVWDASFQYSTSIDPVLVTYESSNNSVYMAFSVESDSYIYIRKLDSDLVSIATYNTSTSTAPIQFQRIISDNPGTEPVVFLTGNINGEILAYKIPDYGTYFGTDSKVDTTVAGIGYDLIIPPGDNTYIYIVGRYSSTTNNGAILKLNQSDLSTVSQNLTLYQNGECLGVTFDTQYDYLYITGYFKNGNGYDRSTALEQVYPPDITGTYLDHSFTYTPAPSSDINDEAGFSIVFDADKQYYAISGFQKRTTSDFSSARASVAIRSYNSDYNEVKTIVFTVANYGESFLRDIVQLGSDYYAVGYAYDSENTKPNSLIIKVSNQ